MYRLKAVCIDCEDAWALAHWWAETLDFRVRDYSPEDLDKLRRQGVDRVEDDPEVAVDPPSDGPMLWFNRVPEPKVGKVRIHLDVYAEVDALVARGATVLERLPSWTVMTDPEGNEFCAFPPE
jgi:hypothetical protein